MMEGRIECGQDGFAVVEPAKLTRIDTTDPQQIQAAAEAKHLMLSQP